MRLFQKFKGGEGKAKAYRISLILIIDLMLTVLFFNLM